jgi:alkyldihydroxyacetonephosphate synthase
MDPLESLMDRLPPGAVSTHHGELAVHARDRWALAMLREARGDRVAPAAALVFPKSTEDVSAVLRWADETGTAVVARGGATGVSGGAEAVRRSVVLDLSKMNRVVGVDEVSQTVTVQAGAKGTELETALAKHQLTTGHDLGSMEHSTVGGWIASASAALASGGQGGIEDLILGLTVVLAGGDVVALKAVPRSGAGPDLRKLFVGSEGILGVITEATLSLSRLPSGLVWEAFRPQSFETGAALVREIVQRGYHPLVVRLMDAAEAAAILTSSDGGPILIVGFDHSGPAVDPQRMEMKSLAREFGARPMGADLAEWWWDHRHDEFMWYDQVMGKTRSLGRGVIADTFDVAAVWRHIPRLYEDVREALLDACEEVGCRLAHPYRSGAALQFSFVLRGPDDHEVEERYGAVWRGAVTACVRAGGTIAHHQGVGLLKVPFVAEDVGPAAVAGMARVKAALDPKWVLNPGKLIPRDTDAAPKEPGGEGPL